MLILKISFFIMTLLSCGSVDKGDIVVIGKAENAKDGAFVTSRVDGKSYLLDGIISWDEENLGKTIKVSGKLFIEERKKQSNGKILVQERVGITRTILKPKWKVVR